MHTFCVATHARKKDPMRFVDEIPQSKIPARRRLEALERDRDASWEDA